MAQELGLPKLYEIRVTEPYELHSVELPPDVARIRLESLTPDTAAIPQFAFDAEQLSEETITLATGIDNRRTIPFGRVLEINDLKVRHSASLYITARKAAIIEVEVYSQA